MFFASVLIGLFVGQSIVVSYVLVLPCVALLLCVSRLRLVVLLCIGFIVGATRGGAYVAQLQHYQAVYDQNITLQVTAAEDAVYGRAGQLKFVAHDVHLEQIGTVPGKIGISGYGPMAVYQNDTLVVTGKLRKGIGSYQGFMSYAKIEHVESNPSLLVTLRRDFGSGMLSALPEPAASFAMGILIGQRATLPEYTEDNLQKVGLTHIIAVSGANLTIMLEAARRLLGRFSKRLATFGSLGFMLSFVAITGGSASIVRASYVSGLSVWAAYYGRRVPPLLLIVLVAAITAYIEPIYVWSDAAWYLSFLAFYGVLMVSPIMQQRLPTVFQTNILLAIALESLCAEIMALPYVLYTFGTMSRVGLVANVLIVSVIPYAMLASFIAGLAGTFLWPLAGWFSWPAKFLLTYMLDITNWLAGLPNIYQENMSVSLSTMLVLYGLIAAMTMVLGFKKHEKNAMITDENYNLHRQLGRTT